MEISAEISSKEKFLEKRHELLTALIELGEISIVSLAKIKSTLLYRDLIKPLNEMGELTNIGIQISDNIFKETMEEFVKAANKFYSLKPVVLNETENTNYDRCHQLSNELILLFNTLPDPSITISASLQLPLKHSSKRKLPESIETPEKKSSPTKQIEKMAIKSSELVEELKDWEKKWLSSGYNKYEKAEIDLLKKKLLSFANGKIDNLLNEFEVRATSLKCLCLLPPISNSIASDEIFDLISKFVVDIKKIRTSSQAEELNKRQVVDDKVKLSAEAGGFFSKKKNESKTATSSDINDTLVISVKSVLEKS